MFLRRLAFLFLASTTTVLSAQVQHAFFRVTLGPEFKEPVSGRLLVFIESGSGAKEIDADPFAPTPVYVAAKEVSSLSPGASVDIDVDELAYPGGFSTLKPGDYEVQALLDTQHTYNYSGRGAGDLISKVTPLAQWTPGHGEEPSLTLTSEAQGRPEKPSYGAGYDRSAHREDFTSPSLSRFFGRPVQVQAWVVLPPGYSEHPKEHYPTVYWTHGFTGTLAAAHGYGASIYSRMDRKLMPPMIWVMLSEAWTTGTHEFADSVNDGPWGEALTKEFIPYLESKYRMDAKTSGRFLTGHSSGGWATLQLQVNYPKVFGGTWSTSPDPSDFHDFTGVDLYAPHANLYHRPDGSAYPLVRDHGKVEATIEQFAKLERVLGDYGGQFGSFDWVFSPRGGDGRPLPMFNRDTGDIDPKVVDYWRDHWDLAHIVQTDWANRGKDLRGKIHLYVGTADTFYLDGAAHKFEAVLRGLNADPHFTYIPDRTHFDLYWKGDDHGALFDEIAGQMYAVARPGAKR
ncbi:alpha/beta hydrolase [Silvibacterium acidisoli]|uniref:alpha/beta hydrolase n=1 Tax=Acidobacteriaceae bacterium ZG23-2 TaxID=2883246 RepID=UPI00406C021C